MSLTTQNDKPSIAISVIEQVVMMGDLSKLTAEQRVSYYNDVCKSIGLNPLTRPLEYIVLNGKLTLYARKDATEQLRAIKGVSIEKLEEKVVGDVYIVKATAKTKDGRTDTSTGAVAFGHLKGEAQANALMKAETKAKRRVTLSICGLGFLDEMEVETIPQAKNVNVNECTGEILCNPTIDEATQIKKPSPEQIKILRLIMDRVGKVDPSFCEYEVCELKKKKYSGYEDMTIPEYEDLLKRARAALPAAEVK